MTTITKPTFLGAIKKLEDFANARFENTRSVMKRLGKSERLTLSTKESIANKTMTACAGLSLFNLKPFLDNAVAKANGADDIIKIAGFTGKLVYSTANENGIFAYHIKMTDESSDDKNFHIFYKKNVGEIITFEHFQIKKGRYHIFEAMIKTISLKDHSVTEIETDSFTEEHDTIAFFEHFRSLRSDLSEDARNVIDHRPLSAAKDLLTLDNGFYGDSTKDAVAEITKYALLQK